MVNESLPAAPLIDISPLADQTGSARATECINALHRACLGTGFFVVTGHGLEHKITQVFEAARGFFGSPQELKEEVPRTDRYGFVPHASTAIDTNRQSELTEYLELGLHDEVPMPRVDGFEAAVRRYQLAALDLTATLLRALATGLGLDAEFFAIPMADSECKLRFLHYPPAEPSATGELPVSTQAHTDYGAITILATDGVAGLQVRPDGGDWVPVVAAPGDLVINLGDMLARWTNDTYRSTVHRVIGPAEGDRFSIPFFVNPHPDTIVECIPTCVGSDNPCNYDPIRAGDFLTQRRASLAEPYIDE